ncbi:MAG: hypothetical protein QM777_25575 [Pseudorhodoferax sp.]
MVFRFRIEVIRIPFSSRVPWMPLIISAGATNQHGASTNPFKRNFHEAYWEQASLRVVLAMWGYAVPFRFGADALPVRSGALGQELPFDAVATATINKVGAMASTPQAGTWAVESCKIAVTPGFYPDGRLTNEGCVSQCDAVLDARFKAAVQRLSVTLIGALP